MNKNIRGWTVAAVGMIASVALTSCYYDPYGSTSVGGSYSSGYGDGYGYGGSGFSTSLFVSTGNPQWGYDPYCYSYYDYRRRAYYDPYLNGYYPVGYRPAVVYGVPHPYGYRRGGGYIRPPAYVSGRTISGYNDRAKLYQGTSYGWARQVRQQPAERGRVVGSRPSTNSGSSGNNYKSSQSSGNNYSRSNQGSGNNSYGTRQNSNTQGQKQRGTLPSRYNTPVKAADQKGRQAAANKKSSQQAQRTMGTRPPNQGSNNGKSNKNSKEEDNRSFRYR